MAGTTSLGLHRPVGNRDAGTGDPMLPVEGAGEGVTDVGKLADDVDPFLNRPGFLQIYAGDTAPDGWLICDGSSVNRSDSEGHERLFGVIGAKYGTGTGEAGAFSLPDFRGRGAIGPGAIPGGTTRDVGDSGGAETHTLTSGEMPTHTHTVATTGTATSTHVHGAGNVASGPGSPSGSDSATTSSAGTGSPHNNMPPFVVVNFLIKL